MSPPKWTQVAALLLVLSVVRGISGKIGGWDSEPNTQYHIQTDEGPERYFRYQTMSGQYRKERRLQDGTVIGSYGWVDANGLLRLRDYVADHKGYRILRTKMVRVGEPVPPKPAPISLSDYLKEKGREGVAAPQETPVPPTTSPRPPDYVRPVTFRPYFNPNGIDQAVYETVGAERYESPVDRPQSPPKYDGVALTHNGFRYYLPRHYQEEETLPGDKRAGSFGYIDPFGIRRVIYYNTSPGSGFVHRKNNRYVGFQSTPYDPRV